MIVIKADVLLAKRKMSISELIKRIGLTRTSASLLKNGKVKVIKFSMLNKLCEILECQPGDILEHRRDE